MPNIKVHPHRDEMIRLANSPIGTKVWNRRVDSPPSRWGKSDNPSWDEDLVYIVDDRHQKIRRDMLDSPDIRIYWDTPNDGWKLWTGGLDLIVDMNYTVGKPLIYEYQWTKLVEGSTFYHEISPNFSVQAPDPHNGWVKFEPGGREVK